MIVVGVILVLIALVVLFTLQLISKHAASDKQLVFFRDKRTQAKLISKQMRRLNSVWMCRMKTKVVTKASFWTRLSASICRMNSITACCCGAG